MYSPHWTKSPGTKIYNLFWEAPLFWDLAGPVDQARKTHNLHESNFVNMILQIYSAGKYNIMTLSLFLLISAYSLLTSTAILWGYDSLMTLDILTSIYSLLTLCWLSADSLLTLYWLSADFYSSPGWPGWLDLPEGSNCLEFETTTCWDMLAHLEIWISATGHYSRCKFQ